MPKYMTAADLVLTLNDVSGAAARILGGVNLIRSPQLEAYTTALKAGYLSGDPYTVANVESIVEPAIVEMALAVPSDQLSMAELMGIKDAAKDALARTGRLSGGLCGGGKGPSATNPAKLAAGIRMAADRANAYVRLAANDVRDFNTTALELYSALDGHDELQMEYLEAMTYAQQQQDAFLTSAMKDAVFATRLSSNMLGTDPTLTFKVIPATA